MQPQQQPNGQPIPTRDTGFKPKYRQFHPLTRVWVTNPFDHDVLFQVADESGQPYQYRLPAHKVCELPGGAIATLGVKHLVNELIQNNPEDAMRMWDEGVRKRHEDNIILRIKETRPNVSAERPGEVNLGVTSDEIDAPALPPVAPPEAAFPGMNQTQVAPTPPPAPLPQPPAPVPAPDPYPENPAFGAAPSPQAPIMVAPPLSPLPQPVTDGIGNIVSASLPTENKLLEEA